LTFVGNFCWRLLCLSDIHASIHAEMLHEMMINFNKKNEQKLMNLLEKK